MKGERGRWCTLGSVSATRSQSAGPTVRQPGLGEPARGLQGSRVALAWSWTLAWPEGMVTLRDFLRGEGPGAGPGQKQGGRPAGLCRVLAGGLDQTAGGTEVGFWVCDGRAGRSGSWRVGLCPETVSDCRPASPVWSHQTPPRSLPGLQVVVGIRPQMFHFGFFS